MLYRLRKRVHKMLAQFIVLCTKERDVQSNFYVVFFVRTFLLEIVFKIDKAWIFTFMYSQKLRDYAPNTINLYSQFLTKISTISHYMKFPNTFD